jgi:hypothetical protein
VRGVRFLRGIEAQETDRLSEMRERVLDRRCFGTRAEDERPAGEHRRHPAVRREATDGDERHEAQGHGEPQRHTPIPGPRGRYVKIAQATGTASINESTMRAVVCANVRPGLRW